MSKKTPHKLHPDPSLSAIARELGITRQSLTRHLHRGMPTATLEAARAWYTSRIDATRELEKARVQKTLKEIELLELKNAKERGDLLSCAEVREAGVAVGAQLSAECAALVNDMPGLLAGQSEAACRRELNARFERMLSNIRKKIDESVQ